MFPKLILTAEDGAIALPRVPLASGERNEAWLRDLLLRHPEALPAAEIDPAFADPVPVCRELRTPAGPIDALFVNRHGALTLVECKLWRNPQARREVVGQILDYAKELARWRYDDLQREVSRALGRAGNHLHELVTRVYPDTREADFVDAVGRNLRAGRFLLLVAGDGIREGTETIVQFMQDHSGMRFTFGLVEMAGYELPDRRLLVQPRVLARTLALERTVVRIVEPGDDAEERQLDLEPTNQEPAASPERRQRDIGAIEADRRFWQCFVDQLRLDDPTQPMPKRWGVGRVRYEMGVPDIWISAYRARSLDLLGTYISFKGAVGAVVIEALERERQTIDDELRAALPYAELEWGSTPPNTRWVAMRTPVPGTWDAEAERRHVDWLTRSANAFVNTFRPRVIRLLADRSAD